MTDTPERDKWIQRNHSQLIYMRKLCIDREAHCGWAHRYSIVLDGIAEDLDRLAVLRRRRELQRQETDWTSEVLRELC